MDARAVRRQILLSTTMIVGALTGYGGRAYAQGCTNAGGSSFTCTGITDTGQTIAVDNATVSTIAPFEVNTTDPIAINITGDGALSYTDAYASDLTAATTALQVSATGDDGGTPGSITINTDGSLTGSEYGIAAYNAGTGAISITADGNVKSYNGAGIKALNTSGSNIIVTTGVSSYVGGNTSGIYARNEGTGYTTVTADGQVYGTSIGIYANNAVGTTTDLTVTTGNVLAGDKAIYAANAGSGDLRITANGYLFSSSRGIDAHITGSGDGYITTNGTVKGSFIGIATSGGGSSGIWTIEANGNVAGYGGQGISIGANNGASVTTASVHGYSDGIGGSTQSGALSILANGDVTGLHGSGINVSVVNATYGTNLSVTTHGTVMGATRGIYAYNQGAGYTAVTAGANGAVYGTANEAIRVKAANSATNVTVTTGIDSTVSGTGGIFVTNDGSGTTVVTANGGVTGGTARGIYVYGEGTTVTVTTGAYSLVTSDTTGVYAGNGGSGHLAVTVNGEVDAGTVGVNARNNAGTYMTLTLGASAKVTANSYYNGIQAFNGGSGAQRIEVNGLVTSASGNGAVAVNYGTDLNFVTGAGSSVVGARGIRASHYGSGALNITTNGNVIGTTGNGILVYGNTSGNAANITVKASSTVTSAGADAGDFAMQINSGAANVTVAGALNGGGGGAIQFANATNTLELVTGASVTGNVIGGTGTDTLTLSGANTGAFNVSQLQNFEDIDVEAGTWSLSGATTADAQVNGGTLKGTGTFGTLAVNSGTLAPGNSIGTMTVNGAFTLSAGAVYEVEVNAAGESDKVIVNGTVNLTGSVLRVLAASGDYQTSTDYTIIQNDGTDAVVGAFASVTSSLAFLIPTVIYTGGDGNDVVLNLSRNETLFPDVARTRNQKAVAGALEQFPTNNALFLAVLNQTVAGARAAFDALSGEIHATVAGSLIDDSRYVRDAVLGRLVQATYTNSAGQVAALAAGGPQVASLDSSAMALGYGFDGKSLAAPEPEPLAFWTRAYGAWGTFDGDGNAATLDRDLGGFVSGMDAEIWNGWRAGLATGASFSNVDVDARYSSADVETYHLGGYLGGMASVFALRGGGVWAWSDVDTSRAVLFPGFYERQKARYDADTGQLFGEVAYPTQMMGVALEPFGGIAYVTTDSETFREHGGPLASLRGSADQDVGYTTVGLRAGQTMQVAGMLITPNLSVAWLHAFDGVTPDARLAFANTGIGFTVYGVPLAQNSGLIDVGLDFALGPDMTAGVSYSGQFGEDVTDNGVKGRFTWLF